MATGDITVGSGNSIGFKTYNFLYKDSIAWLDDTHFVYVYVDVSNSYAGTATICEINGTTITYGQKYEFATNGRYYVSVSKLSSSKFIIVFEDCDNSNYGTAIIGEVTGTIITYGSPYVFYSGNPQNLRVKALSESKSI